MHPIYGIATILLAHNPLSSLACPMITHIPRVASNLRIKTLVARQWPTSIHAAVLQASGYVHVYMQFAWR